MEILFGFVFLQDDQSRVDDSPGCRREGEASSRPSSATLAEFALFAERTEAREPESDDMQPHTQPSISVSVRLLHSTQILGEVEPREHSTMYVLDQMMTRLVIGPVYLGPYCILSYSLSARNHRAVSELILRPAMQKSQSRHSRARITGRGDM